MVGRGGGDRMQPQLGFQGVANSSGERKGTARSYGERLMFPSCSLGFAVVETLWRVGIAPTHPPRENRLGPKSSGTDGKPTTSR